MKISEYINILQNIANDYGDLEVETLNFNFHRVTAMPPKVAYRAILNPRERKPVFFEIYKHELNQKGQIVCRIQ